MLTRAELYATIDYSGYEALDESIVKTLVPHGMPQRGA
jgi:methylisocitrate lyase